MLKTAINPTIFIFVLGLLQFDAFPAFDLLAPCVKAAVMLKKFWKLALLSGVRPALLYNQLNSSLGPGLLAAVGRIVAPLNCQNI